MSKYQGDYRVAAVVRGMFSTQTAAGAPVTLAGTPSLSVYKDASDTQTTTGVTLGVDADTVTGMHRWAVDTADAFYAAGSDFWVRIAAGTVDGVSVINRVIGHFSIENRSALLPQVAGRTLAVDADHEAAVNVKSVNDVAIIGDGDGTPFNVA